MTPDDWEREAIAASDHARDLANMGDPAGQMWATLALTYATLAARHEAAIRAEPLDVERLARALHNQFWVTEITHAPDGELACIDMETRSASEVARDYAALGRSADEVTDDGERLYGEGR